MTKPSSFNQYRHNYSVADRWKLNAANTDNISQVVVIPAYAEKNMLFSTLASLARNQPASLDYSFVLCVINNKSDSPEDVKENNKKTLEYLDALLFKKNLANLIVGEDFKDILKFIADAELRLGYVDASSPGVEIPENDAGVGMARKIGMDIALNLLTNSSSKKNIIISLDADTLVQSNYLATIKNCFNEEVKTAIIAYEHQEPADDEGRAAIYCYEIFLRYWLLGLKYAQSPYAFHSIGSTIVCSTDAYLDVRGMNRRKAGEDFYFLNKLAKNSTINYIKNTCVYPSPRASDRVPFGTGSRIQRFLNHKHQEYVLPDPQIFAILGKWLKLMEHPCHYDGKDILINAGVINPFLASFLTACNFEQVWMKIRKNVNNEKRLVNQFHGWFDGFRTLKLINYLSREFSPPINMFSAVEIILKLQNIPVPSYFFPSGMPELVQQKAIISYLRRIT